MNYKECIIEKKLLSKSVLCIWELKGTSVSKPIRYIPKCQDLVVFNYSKKSHYDKVVFLPLGSSTNLIADEYLDYFGITFVREGVHKLNAGIAELASFFDALWDKLKGLTFEEKIERVLPELEQTLGHAKESRALSQAFNYIEKCVGCCSVEELSQKCKVSTRTLQRLFKSRLNITPKKYLQAFRISVLLEEMLQQNELDVQEFIHKYQYFDQAHFIKEIREYTKLSPLQLYKKQDSLNKLL